MSTLTSLVFGGGGSTPADVIQHIRSDMVDSSAVLVVLITIILPPIGMTILQSTSDGLLRK